ncbi:MAG: exonuclease SbcCD subunit D C-terminal domain-containing protein [Sphaerochaeta sp.]|nr:exonuclease SbcCD subunit D C-terminal domain-containing protein [Sphaerochaeta sp.]
MVRITGDLAHITTAVDALKLEGSSAWLEIEYTGTDASGNLREQIEELLEGSSLVVTIIKNKRTNDQVLSAIHEHETLEDLDSSEVFKRCLDAAEIPEDERGELTASYNEIVQTLAETDLRAD